MLMPDLNYDEQLDVRLHHRSKEKKKERESERERERNFNVNELRERSDDFSSSYFIVGGYVNDKKNEKKQRKRYALVKADIFKSRIDDAKRGTYSFVDHVPGVFRCRKKSIEIDPWLIEEEKKWRDLFFSSCINNDCKTKRTNEPKRRRRRFP